MKFLTPNYFSRKLYYEKKLKINKNARDEVKRLYNHVNQRLKKNIAFPSEVMRVEVSLINSDLAIDELTSQIATLKEKYLWVLMHHN